MNAPELTRRQQQVLGLLRERRDRGEPPPSYREIGETLGLPHVSAVAKHIAALRRRGLLVSTAGKSRSLRLPPSPTPDRPRNASPPSSGHPLPSDGKARGEGAFFAPSPVTREDSVPDGLPRFVRIPVFGAIPAGLPADRVQDHEGCLNVDLDSLGIRPTNRTFALRVSGDSMIGKHVLDGDLVVIEHGKEPRPGDIVAALIDGQSTLKTYLLQRGRPFLRAENPRYPDLIPAAELVIQGVVVALIRKRT